MQGKTVPVFQPNMSLVQVLVSLYKAEYPKENQSPAAVLCTVKEWLSDPSMLIRLGIKNVFNNEAEANAWDDKEPAREQERELWFEIFMEAYYGVDVAAPDLPEPPSALNPHCRAESHLKSKWNVYSKAMTWAQNETEPGTCLLSCRTLAKYLAMDK